MQWSAFLVLSSLILTDIITNPINKHSSKYKPAKHTVLRGKIRFTATPIKSNTNALKYLTQFGYNPCENPPGSQSDSHDRPSCQSSMKSMLEKFQTTYHLPITGKLDAATLRLMNKPRCGLPDTPLSLMYKSKLWPKNRILKWKLDHDHGFYDSTKTRQRIQEAFDDWANHTELTFREVSQHEKADFKLAFVYGDHADGFPLDGRGGNLAHAFHPWQSYPGQIHFDSSEKWSDTYDSVGVNLRLVASHEIGHSLGLPHTFDKKSIMYSVYQLILPKNMLPKQDQRAIQALYGKKQRTVPSSYSSASVKTKTPPPTTTKQTTTTTTTTAAAATTTMEQTTATAGTTMMEETTTMEQTTTTAG